MIYKNTDQLRGWLTDAGFVFEASQDEFDLDNSEYLRHLLVLNRRPEDERADAAAFRCLTFDKKPPAKILENENPPEYPRLVPPPVPPVREVEIEILKDIKRALFVIVALLTFILGWSVLAHAQTPNVNPALVVSSCGGGSVSAGARVSLTVDTTQVLCVSSSGGGGGSVNITQVAGHSVVEASSGIMKVSIVDSNGAAITNADVVATSVADGSNVTLGAKADAKSTATDTTAVTIMQVLKEISAMEQAPASRAVTNAGTFAVQASQSTASSLNATVVGTGTFAVQAAESGTWTVQPGNTANTTAWLAYNGDPCQNPANTIATDTLSFASTSVQKLITKTSAKKNYLCALFVHVGGTAETWSIIEGTKTTNECDTGAAALSGSTTAANGNADGANGGMAWGNGGGSVIRGKTSNNDLCIVTNGSNRVDVTYTWTQQ
jgi:hypothetical protein